MSPKKSNKPHPKNPYDKRKYYSKDDIRHHMVKTKQLIRKRNKMGITYAVGPEGYVPAPPSPPVSRPPTPRPSLAAARRLDFNSDSDSISDSKLPTSLPDLTDYVKEDDSIDSSICSDTKMPVKVTPYDAHSNKVESTSKGEDPPVPVIYLEILPPSTPAQANNNKPAVEKQGVDEEEKELRKQTLAAMALANNFMLPIDCTMQDPPKKHNEEDEFRK